MEREAACSDICCTNVKMFLLVRRMEREAAGSDICCHNVNMSRLLETLQSSPTDERFQYRSSIENILLPFLPLEEISFGICDL